MASQQQAEIQEEKLLIIDNSYRAEEPIAQAKEKLPVLNELIEKYNAFGFERKITSKEDIADLIQNFDNFIQTERLKAVPETVAGLKINRVEFLKTVVAKPEGLVELKAFARSLTYNHFEFNLYRFDKKKGTFYVCDQACDKFRDDHNYYAKGNQIKALKAGEKLVEILTELRSYGIYNTEEVVVLDPNHYGGDGIPYYRLKDKAFCLKVPVSQE